MDEEAKLVRLLGGGSVASALVGAQQLRANIAGGSAARLGKLVETMA